MSKWIESNDGSFTAYSNEYDEHYHSTKDGALNESLKKHIEPAFNHHSNKSNLRIIDICFGLGFNTLLSLYYRDHYYPNMTLEIFSPELDGELVDSLAQFPYPQIFEKYKSVIESIALYKYYKDSRTEITVQIEDARLAIHNIGDNWDICYQDAFSPSANPILWTQEYFSDIVNILNEEGILTTYSTALKTRLALYLNGFFVYLNEGNGYRNATIATKNRISDYPLVDMKHKIQCNPSIIPLRDGDFFGIEDL